MKPIDEPERLAVIWGLNISKIKQAWDWLVLGKERQKEGKLNRVETLVFLLNALKSPEVDYLTASLADNLYYQKLGQNSPQSFIFYRYFDFLVEKMPDEIMVDKISRPRKYFTSEKMPKIEAEREQRRREAAAKKEKLNQLIRENEGCLSKMVSSLEKQGIRITPVMLSRQIIRDEELRELAKKVRKAKKEKPVSQIKKPAAKKEAEPLLKAKVKEVIRLPLDELDRTILEFGVRTPEEAHEKLGILLMVAEARIKRSIPAKFGVEKLEKAREIFEKEMVTG